MKYTLSNTALLERLSVARGASGDEGYVTDIVRDILRPLCDGMSTDTLGNLTALKRGRSSDKRITVSAHMDEVGFMITEIDGRGLLRFSCVGGIDPAVLCGKRVRVGDAEIPGVISSLPYHLLPKDKRLKAPSEDELYIDIGALSKENAERCVSLGDCAVFDSEFTVMGDKIKGKALDDRAGAFIMLELLRIMDERDILPAYDTYFCFTVREEIGYSGAGAIARRLKPDLSIILETTAIGDVLGAPEHKTVAGEGEGGVVSPLDRGTVYQERIVDFAMQTAQDNGIKAQLKRYVSGGNDAAHIQKSCGGTPVMALSIPTRYLHSPACVMDIRDIEAMTDHTLAMLNSPRLAEILRR